MSKQVSSSLHTPVLILGTFERVGSNWFTASLDSKVAKFNEPFRQQLHPSHCLSTLQATPGSINDLTAFGRYWIGAFVASKYTSSPTAIKETNLFFSAEHLLSLFPDAPVVVLTRNALGIASSFKEDGLYDKWDYSARYEQLARLARSAKYRQWAFTLPDDDHCLRRLVRLMVLNALLLADALGTRPYSQIPYELSVTQPDAVTTLLAQVAPNLDVDLAPKPVIVSPLGHADDTFSPHIDTNEVIACLDPSEREVVESELFAVLSEARSRMSIDVVERAATMLSSSDIEYALKPPPAAQSRSSERRHQAQVQDMPAPRYVQLSEHLQVCNYLVSNTEFAAFLNRMHATGVHNVVEGTHILALESMPPGRGGRVHFDGRTGCYQVLAGYEHHPVYWVTWLGAAAFARCAGARLPSFAEMQQLFVRTPRSDGCNVDFRVGDVTGVNEQGRAADEVHHAVGNVQVWCEDGPEPNNWAPSTLGRYYVGAAWNSPGDHPDLARRKVRHIAASSRGIGIRLVRDVGHVCPPVDPTDVAARITSATGSLARDLSILQIDELIASAVYTQPGVAPG